MCNASWSIEILSLAWLSQFKSELCCLKKLVGVGEETGLLKVMLQLRKKPKTFN